MMTRRVTLAVEIQGVMPDARDLAAAVRGLGIRRTWVVRDAEVVDDQPWPGEPRRPIVAICLKCAHFSTHSLDLLEAHIAQCSGRPQRKATDVECTFCGASAGRPCRTPDNQTSSPHAVRWRDSRR
jgi:hypothetical protein